MIDTEKTKENLNNNILILEMINANTDLRELMQSVLHYMKNLSGCEAVGIRLRDGEDFPYYEVSGFSMEFVKAEMHLCIENLDGQLERDDIGNPVIDCMCGNVICGRFDPSKEFFTDNGSFVSNCTTKLLASTTEEDRQARTRNRCNGEGYESVFLVPLRTGEKTFGLLQFNDHRENHFSPQFVALAERLANNIATALAHRHAEDELKKSEEKYRGLLSNLPQKIFQKNSDSVYLSCNDKYANDLKIAPHEIKGKTDFDFYPKELAEKYQADDQRLMKFGKTEEIEESYIRDGKEYIVQTVKVPLTDNAGNITGIQGIFWDITDRKLAETKLRESEQRQRALSEASFESIFFSEKGVCIDQNEIAAKMFGYNRDEAIGMLGTDWIALEDRELVKNNMQSGYEEPYDIKALRKNGTTFPAEIQARSINYDGRNIRVIALRDITEIKRLKELEFRAGRLETAGIIAGQVAHDFNNLLGPLIAYPDFIREELPHDHKALPYLDDIEKAAKKIADINQELLTLSRRGYYNKEVLNLNQIVLHVIKDIQPLTSSVMYKTKLHEDLKQIDGGNAQIHRILTNLLINAADAMLNMGQVTIKTENYYADNTAITYCRVPKGDYVKLTVTDTGCGISEDIIQKIFDPFFTTKTTDKIRGSGLGLSVVDSVMKDHNGYIDISSTIGQGASFYLYFPVSRESVGGSSEPEIKTEGNESVLVIDDDQIQREVSAKILKKLGYKVTTASSGEEAIDFLKENRQDLLVLDMIMPPGIDGAETYKRVLEIYPNQKAIIVSGFSESDRVAEAQKLGAGAFIKKPLTQIAIAAAIRTELDR